MNTINTINTINTEYAARVEELEAEGMTTSDAQGVADCEAQCGECREWFPRSERWYLPNGTGVRFGEMTAEKAAMVSTWELRCECCDEDRREKFTA